MFTVNYLVRFLGTTEHSCARADPPVPDLVGRLLERARALAFGQAGTVRLVRDLDYREYGRNRSHHLSFRGRQTEGL